MNRTTVAAPDEGATRVLVVEDERIVARDLVETLTALGYVVVASVATGKDAIEQARIHRPGVILMDIRLADAIDGIEAAGLILAEQDVPVIYLTAHADDDTLRRAKATAPLGYLIKPFRSAELRCAIEIAVHKHEIDARVRVHEQSLASTLRSIGDGVVATDLQQRVTLLNSVAEALTGWKHEEPLGRVLGEIMSLVTEATGAPVECPGRTATELEGVTTLQSDLLLQARPRSAVPISDSTAPLLDSEGTTIGGVVVFRDASMRRQVEDDVGQTNVELERRVAERTQQLEMANRELEAFTFSVAHDLRAPLRGIEGFSQALLEEHAANLGPEGLVNLKRVRAAASRMTDLIADLLRLSRTANSPLERQTFDLSVLAWNVSQRLRSFAPGRHVDVQIQPDLLIEGDRGLIRIVLENLLGNAWKFTSHQAEPLIELGASEREGERTIFVRDNGAGFDSQGAERLFGAFQRFHAATEFEGNGVGLSIVQRIVSRHGGRIWAESMRGHGATFYLVL
ncbi:MAG TPA: ATP-binding protein [Kofleriaceae bacterium]|nr:ATP-binding protein [Kofleriaceae bacterium]